MKPREPRRLRPGEKQTVYGAFTSGRARKKLPAAKHPLLSPGTDLRPYFQQPNRIRTPGPPGIVDVMQLTFKENTTTACPVSGKSEH